MYKKRVQASCSKCKGENVIKGTKTQTAPKMQLTCEFGLYDGKKEYSYNHSAFDFQYGSKSVL